MSHDSKRGGRASKPDAGAGRFNGYRWLDGPADYREAAALPRGGVVPLLAPAGRQRRKRWEAILKWYGLGPAAESAEAPPPEVGPGRSDVVVGFDDEYQPAAAVLAAATGRVLVVAPPDDPLRPLRDRPRPASVVFVGRPHNLRKASLHVIARSLDIPWGVLTANDLAAMSFVVAKQLANFRRADRDGARRSDEGALLLDAPAETVKVVGAAEPDGGYSLTDGASLRELLATRSFEHMVVHAHGEGAHANLKTAVLCGLLGESESWRGGELPGGCRQAGSKRFCKRASRQRRHVFSFGDLRARNLYFLSCNGFTTDGELYPTEVSAVLSAAEGYPASVLTSDRSLGIEVRLPALAFHLTRQGLAPSAVCEALNRIMAFGSGIRPFVLCGDPLGSAALAPADARDGNISLPPGGAARLVDLKSWEAATVIGFSKEDAEVHLFRGEGLGALLAGGGKRRRVRLEDFSARWEARRDRLVTFARRHQRMSRTIALIKDFWWEKYRAGAGFPERLEELEAAGDRLLVATQRSLRGVETIRRDGVWDARVDLLCGSAERLAGLWDQCFARVVEDHILDCDLPPLFLHDRLQVVSDCGEECGKCGMGLVLTVASDYVEGRVAASATDCPNCGPQELWQAEGVRFVVKGDAVIHPGKTYSFSVEERAECGTQASPRPAAYVVAQFQNLGGKPFFSEVSSTSKGKARFRAPVPANCSSDMQTLRIAWVQGLTVSAWTQQYASVPAGKGAGEAPARAAKATAGPGS